jgi:heme exporter protein D
MSPVDASTWQAFGVTLTVVGLLISVLVWRRRGAGSGLRAVAWSLLPAAAGFTGTLRLLWEIGDSVVGWATRLVFSPFMWFGIALAGVSVLLFGFSAVLRARQPARSQRSQRSDGTGRLPSSRAPVAAPTGGSGEEDMADIEAILRKHGIS